MPYIEFQGAARPIGPGVLTVGGAPAAGWRIQGRGLEPLHLLLSVETGGKALLIKGSRNAAVQVNGVELASMRTLLSFGDCIVAGTAELWYRRLPPGTTGPAAYLRDTRRGRLYQLRERSTIGRDMSSTVIVQEADVSRLHAELVQRGDTYVIIPHGVSVTSINGSRLIEPTVLQEGDEIAVGRTVMRFTTALPSQNTLASSGAGAAKAGKAAKSKADPPAQAGRESRVATSFMGAIEVQDRQSRVTRRRLTRAAVMAMTAIAMAAVIVSLYAGRHPLPQPSDPTLARGAKPAGASDPAARSLTTRGVVRASTERSQSRRPQAPPLQ
jgi:hypothetical protein